jgi:TatD DNase family protein
MPGRSRSRRCRHLTGQKLGRKMVLLDAHVHLDAYGSEIDAVFDEIVRHQILTIAVASDLSSWQNTLGLASRCALVIPAFGIHPARAAAFKGQFDELLPCLDNCGMIGEIGLDYHWVTERSGYPTQRRILEFFLEQAANRSLIVNLHTKGAEQDILSALEGSGIRKSIVHWYSGPPDLVEPLLEQGAYFTFGCELPFSSHIRQLLSLVPDNRILTETDNPAGYEWLTGETGMPRHLHAVVSELARLRGSAAEEMSRQVWSNFLDLVQGNAAMQTALHRIGTPES